MKLFNTLLVLLIFSIGTVYAQQTVSGSVTDQDGEPVIGATVLAKGTSTGTTTDLDGKYTLEVPQGVEALVFSYIGFATQEVAIGSDKTINVVMSEGVELDKVVVTALGVSRQEKTLGYANQQVDGDQLDKARDANFLNTLQGKVAGVQITGSSNLGGSTRILLRGAGSITGNNQPLFVVDGIPLDNSNFSDRNQERGAGGYDYGNAISDINPDDIESINVLKGPAGAALYGDRGANGVIVITTKKGSRPADAVSPIGISINSGVQFNEVAVLPNYQNRYGGGSAFVTSPITGDEIVNYSLDGSWGPEFNGQQVRHWDSYDEWDTQNFGQTRPWEANPNNVQDFFQTGVLATNSISLSGANTAGAFRLGYTNMHQIGTQVNSSLNRHNVSLNANYNLTDKLNVFASGNFSSTHGNGRPNTGYSLSVMSQFNQWYQRQLDTERLRNYKNPDGTQRTWNRESETDPTAKYFNNPFWDRYENGQRDRRERLFGNVGFRYEIMEGLGIGARAMTDFYTDRREEWIAVGGVDEARYEEAVRFLRENNYEVKIDYTKRFGEDISLSSFIGTNYRTNLYDRNVAATQGGLNTPGLYNLSNSVSELSIDDNTERRAIMSAFANASVGYKDFVYLDASYRFDISSTLPLDNNLYHFYSIGGSFIFSEILPKNNILSFGKYRISYGLAGNSTEPYRLQNAYITNPNFDGNGATTVGNILFNADLRPEQTRGFETGLDLRFFNDRLGLDVTYYNQTTINLIFAVSQSAATGYTSRFTNAGNVLNYGVEIAAYGTPVKTKSGFRWDLGFNFAKNQNQVVSLAEGTDNIRLSSLFGVALEARVGEAYGTFVGTDYVYDDAGNRMVGPNGAYLVSEPKALGSVLADFTGGVSTTLSYKGLSLFVLFDFQAGGKLFSLSNVWGKYSGILAETAEGDIRDNGVVVDGVAAQQDANGEWVSTGQPNTANIDAQTHFFLNQGYTVNAADIYDASFVKFREARLSYTLPNKIFGKTPFRDVTIGVVGRNLAILHRNVPHIDPEAAVNAGNVQGFEGGQLPTERSIGVNLNLKF